METTCTCRNEFCAKREAIGLKPFCQITTGWRRPRPENVFSSYEAATVYSREHGGRIQSVTVPGGPRRFAVWAQ